MNNIVKKTILFFFCIICFNLLSDNTYFNRGVDFFKARDYRSAAENLEKALGEETGKGVIHYYLGASLYNLKIFSGAIPHLERYLLEEELANPGMYRESVNFLLAAYRSEKRWDDTMEKGSRILDRIKESKQFSRISPAVSNAVSAARSARASELFRNKDYAKAAGLFRKALEENPSNNSLLERIGMSEYESGSYKAAEEYFLRFLESPANNWRTISMSAYCLTRITPDRLKAAESLRQKNRLSADILAVYSLLVQNRYSEGFSSALLLEEENKTGGSITMDIINRINRDIPDRHRLYMGYIQNHPLSPQAIPMARRILQENRNRDDRQEIFSSLQKILQDIIDKSIPEEKKPEYEKLLLDTMFNSAGEETDEFLKEKIEKYTAFAAKYPGSVISKSVMFDVAMTYANNLGQDDMAEKILEEMKESRDINASMELARIYGRQGKHAEANLLLRKLAEKSPGNENLQMMLGESLLNSGTYDEGITMLREIQEKTKNQRTRDRLSEMIGGYTEIPLQSGSPECVMISLTESEEFFSTMPGIGAGSEGLSRQVIRAGVYPVSAERSLFPFELDMKVPGTPSLAEPYTIFQPDGKGFLARWKSETFSVPDRWRPVSLFSVIYPWKEGFPEGMKIDRKSFFEGGELVSEIEIRLPDEGWQISVLNPSLSMRKDGITPKPDYSGNSRWVFENRSGILNIRMVYPARADIMGYYPEVKAVRKLPGENLKAVIKEGLMEWGEISLKAGTSLVCAEISRKKEKTVNLAEKVERK